MLSKIRSLGLTGVAGYEVTAECFLSSGLPGFEIVGLPDAAVKEARERVRAAVKNCGMKFPVSRITVNLAPADRKKEGTVYDPVSYTHLDVYKRQASHRPPRTLKLNLPELYPRAFASCVEAKSSRMSVNTPVYVAGLDLGVRPIGDWSIFMTLSKFSIPNISS